MKDWKYHLGQLFFWTVVFGMVLCCIIVVDNVLLPWLKGTLCECSSSGGLSEPYIPWYNS